VVNEVALVQSASVARAGPSWHDHRPVLTRAGAVMLVLIAWEVVARSGTVSPLFLSSPSQVVARLAQLFGSGLIWPHLRASG
jgi:ABC-type nitrate/sulfonate/bicarbonate transport system permease component